ncbi:MAG TPA: ferritin-like domain-containing protein [Gaiellaceae bacterium]|jgi:ferritin-like protein|nr:ferritin-like domain-containing protein [Gaiellaceae bacterium]
MGRASIELIGGHLDGAEIAEELDRLYCYEHVVAHWCRGVENRLIGFASVVLGEELRRVAAEAISAGERLAARIAQLGGATTADPTEFLERAELEKLWLPRDYSSVEEILSVAIGYERAAITDYHNLLSGLRDLDVITHLLLAEILAAKLAREDELESVLSQASVAG